MRFIGVCGGRKYSDAATVARVLGSCVKFEDVIVEGSAVGADRLAWEWALRNARHVVSVPALWEVFGNSAGPRRNAVIAALPLSLLIAFPGDRGTADMVAKAKAKGIEVLEVER